MTTAVLVELCNDLDKHLEGYEDKTAVVLRARARHLAEVFKRWRAERPSTSERQDAMNELVDLNRGILVYISKKTRPGI